MSSQLSASPKDLVGQWVGLRRLRTGIFAVKFAHLLIGHLHEQDAGAMRHVLYKHGVHQGKNINCNPCIVSKVLPMCCPHAHPSPLLEGEGEIVFRWP